MFSPTHTPQGALSCPCGAIHLVSPGKTVWISFAAAAANSARLFDTLRHAFQRVFLFEMIDQSGYLPLGRSGLLAVGAFAPCERFAAGKTSAQAGFTAQPLAALPPYGCGVPLAGIPAEHVKSPLVSIKITTPDGVVIFMPFGFNPDIFSLDLLTGEPPNGPSGPRRFCAVQAFWPAAKTLAQAEFISAEH